MPDIYEYLNYRKYLEDYYEAAKTQNPAFSYRYFSRRAGYSSPNFLKLIIKGERNLGDESIPRFAKALGLKGDERRFFRNLVDFEQAKTAEDKNTAYEKVAASTRFRQARRIDHDLFSYLSNWYYPAIREMSARADFHDDPVWIAGELLPAITPEEAARALEVLFDLQLLVRGEEGRIHRGDPSLTTGHEVQALAVGNYHRQMLNQASTSISRIPSQQRDISALTVCIDGATRREVKDRIHDFRERLLDLCDRVEIPNRVYQLNIQFFPLTGPDEPADDEDDGE
ncbi:MAG: hypothetical protein AUK47_11490 [Deltaproteobacteria bacterium CG2_30_63_29]|nr:MAG: hypothetical protein AUK47_11490 [Deltaproteobacteria bacterium CG2_30_63_29]PJB49282.1 MAG: hypothetical protein CO108_00400 [Deltaproteobacteria bacterium CG_4_9_14_3_um_filter_63_12]